MMHMIRAFLDRAATQLLWRKYKAVSVEGMADQHMTVPLYQHYGFTSMPPKDCEVIVISDGNNQAVVAEDHEDRPSVNASETEIYNSDQDTSILLNQNGDVIVTGQKATITISGSSGNVAISSSGTISLGPSGGAFQTLVDERIIAAYNGHFHTCPSGGGTSGPPTVQIGPPPGTIPCTTATTQAA